MTARALVTVATLCRCAMAGSQVSSTIASSTTITSTQKLFSVYSETFANDTYYNTRDGYNSMLNQAFFLQYDYTQRDSTGRPRHFNVTNSPDGNGTALRISVNSADQPHTAVSATKARSELLAKAFAIWPRTNYTITWEQYLAEIQSPQVAFAFV
jgi:hypothetical protein